MQQVNRLPTFSLDDFRLHMKPGKIIIRMSPKKMIQKLAQYLCLSLPLV